MHNCVRCGRAAASLEEIDNGCPCGSKVFVFNKESVEEKAAEGPPPKTAQGPLQVPQAQEQPQQIMGEEKSKAAPIKESAAEKAESSGKAPESYFARTTFTSEDVENIKIIKEGVFLVDIKALSENPVVLKDEEGVYYVKLPFENSVTINGKPISGDGGNAKDRL